MQLNGMIRTDCPPKRLMIMLNDPEVLAQMVPPGSEISQTGPRNFAFTIRKSLGPLKLNLPGTLTLTPTGEGANQHLSAHASHLIAGKVDVELDIRLERREEITVLTYLGTLVATGLAGRSLGQYEKRVQMAMRTVFLRLKAEAELGRKPAAGAAGNARGPGIGGPGKPGQGKPGPGMGGPGKPGQGKPGQGKPGQGMAGQGKAGPGKQGPGKPGQGKPGAGKAAMAKAATKA